MKRLSLTLLVLGTFVTLILTPLHKNSSDTPPLTKLKEQYATKTKPSVDHSLFPELRKKFNHPQDVTAACISCHNGRAEEVMHSSHWQWERTEYIAGKGIRSVGKRNILNNFCIGVQSNEQSCTRCHAGYGYANDKAYFADSLDVDCLACHDNSGTYAKMNEGAGMPDTSVNLSYVAQHVGLPTRTDCGTCHFFGGGGNNVKHGDLEEALFNPARDVDVIYINPTWLVPAIVGGVIMGIGFIIGGYCPGTSVCAAAIGKVDAMFFVGGGLIGVFTFGELFPLYENFYTSTALGPIKVFDSLGMPQGVFAFILVAVAVAAFAITTLIERRVDEKSAPSLQFRPLKHVAAGTFAVALGVIFIFMPDHKTSLIEKVTAPSYAAVHPVDKMDADELAFRIVDHELNIRIIDIRAPKEYAALALLNSYNVQRTGLFGKDWVSTFSQRHLRKVVVGDDETQERTAYYLLHELGYENVAILRGGIGTFKKTILDSTLFVPTGSRWDADVKEFREGARTAILKMIADAKNKPVETVVKRKIQGGC